MKLAPLWLLSFVCAAVRSNPDWVIDYIAASKDEGPNAPTLADKTQKGFLKMSYEPTLPITEGSAFVLTFSNTLEPNTIELFTLSAQKVLSYSPAIDSVDFTEFKNEGGSCWLLASSLFSPNRLVIQPITASGNLMAASGTKITKTDLRVPRTVDRPGSIYFWGLSRDRLRSYNVLDGTYTSSAVVGAVTSEVYHFLVHDIPSLNCMLVGFPGNKVLGQFDRTTMAVIRTQDFSGNAIGNTIIDKTTQTTIWNTNVNAASRTYLEKRAISTTGPTIVSTITTSSQLLNYEIGEISQIKSLSLIWLGPNHSSAGTSAIGMMYFFREASLEVVINFLIPSGAGFSQNFDHVAPDLPNPSFEGFRRFYIGAVDTLSSNLHVYYLLVDTCMNPADSSITCTTCPNGYYRRSSALPGARRCISPSAFPARTGMRNDTFACEVCAVANCLVCTFDYASCELCDTANGYYLNTYTTPVTCQQISEFAVGFGLDFTQTKLQPCKDSKCLDCKLGFEVCVGCDTANSWYLYEEKCMLPESLKLKLGPDKTLGMFRSCSSSGCTSCPQDFLICESCESLEGWFLDPATRSCKTKAELGPRQGINMETQEFSICQDAKCASCEDDYLTCSACTNSADIIIDGQCRDQSDSGQSGGGSSTLDDTDSNGTGDIGLPGTGLAGKFLKDKQKRYYINNATAALHFSSPILLVYQGFFTDAFTMTLTDTLTGRSYQCQDSLERSAVLRCSVAVYGSVLAVRIATDAQVIVGRLTLTRSQPASRLVHNRNLQARGGSGIVHAASRVAFDSYPLTVDGVSTQPDPYLFWAAQLIDKAKNLRPITGVLLAGLSISLSVLLDKQLANLEYLAVLEGPILVYPQQVFDIVGAASIFWPTELVGAPGWLTEISRVSSCRPTAALERQGYQCGVLGSLGADLYVGLAITFICLVITVVSDKVIDSRARLLIEPKSKATEEHFELLQTTDRKHLTTITIQNRTGPSPPISNPLHIPGTTATEVSSKGTNIEVTTSRGAEDFDDPPKELRCLPTGRVTGQLDFDVTALRTAWWRNTYGVTFFFARVEGNQLKALVFVALNYANASHGTFEQYSLIAAIIFTLYYIFQGYFTYQFAAKIWKELAKSCILEDSKSKGASPTQISAGQLTNTPHSLRNLLPVVMKGPNRDMRSVLFEITGIPTHLRHLLAPSVWQLRCFLLALVAVAITKTSLAQVILALIVEIAYLVFIITSLKMSSPKERRIEIGSHTLICLYLILKAATLGVNMSEKTKQISVGYIMAWILVLYGTIAVALTISKCLKLLYIRVKRGSPWLPKVHVQRKVMESAKTMEPQVPILAAHEPEGATKTNKHLPSNEKAEPSRIAAQRPNKKQPVKKVVAIVVGEK